MTTRQTLPARRQSETVHLVHRGVEHTFGVSRFDDGRVAEVFAAIYYGKGVDAETYARDASIILSLALQYGTPLDTIWGAMTRDHLGKPVTLIGAIVERLVSG